MNLYATHENQPLNNHVAHSSAESAAKAGQDLRDARRRRRIPVAIAAERASISRMTLSKIEKGDPGVAMGHYAPVLFVMGMADRIGDIADAKGDSVGLQLEEEHLPQRIRTPGAKRKQGE